MLTIEFSCIVVYNPIFDSKRAEMPLFLGIIRSFDMAKT